MEMNCVIGAISLPLRTLMLCSVSIFLVASGSACTITRYILPKLLKLESIQTTVISLQGSQDIIGADACFLTSGSINVQLVLREVGLKEVLAELISGRASRAAV